LPQLGKVRKVSTQERFYPRAEGCPAGESERKQWIAKIAKANDLNHERVANLLQRYGTATEDFAKRKEKSWRTPLKTLPDYTVGEIEHIANNECILHLSDLVRRRSIITLLGLSNTPTLSELADIVGATLGWDGEQRRKEIDLALKEASGRR